MAKKKKFDYKNVKVNEEELSITKIGEMPNEDKSPIFIFLVFGILLIFIFFLPNIVNYVTNNGVPILEKNPPKESTSGQENIPQKEISYYPISDTLTVNIEEGIVANQFKIEDSTLTFKVTNHLSSRYYFSKHNYFIELYDDNKTLLERLIMTKNALASKETVDESYSITASNATQIVFVEKTIEDYPNVELTTGENQDQMMVCKKDYTTLTYHFNEEKLQSITDVMDYPNNGSTTFQEDLLYWQNQVATYNSITGVTSSFGSNANGFIVNTVIDLQKASLNKMENENYYALDTMPKVVHFEMLARGYQCN